VGQILGSLIAGVVAEAAGLALTFWAFAGVAVLSALIRPRTEQPQSNVGPYPLTKCNYLRLVANRVSECPRRIFARTSLSPLGGARVIEATRQLPTYSL
jgi:hypothetical protein